MSHEGKNLCEVMDVERTYVALFAIHINTKLVCFTPETNTMSCVSYISKNKSMSDLYNKLQLTSEKT